MNRSERPEHKMALGVQCISDCERSSRDSVGVRPQSQTIYLKKGVVSLFSHADSSNTTRNEEKVGTFLSLYLVLS